MEPPRRFLRHLLNPLQISGSYPLLLLNLLQISGSYPSLNLFFLIFRVSAPNLTQNQICTNKPWSFPDLAISSDRRPDPIEGESAKEEQCTTLQPRLLCERWVKRWWFLPGVAWSSFLFRFKPVKWRRSKGRRLKTVVCGWRYVRVLGQLWSLSVVLSFGVFCSFPIWCSCERIFRSDRVNLLSIKINKVTINNGNRVAEQFFGSFKEILSHIKEWDIPSVSTPKQYP